MSRLPTVPADGLELSITLVNATEGHGIADFDESAADTYMTYPDPDDRERDLIDVGDIYRAMVEEYGRCGGRVYVDREGGPVAVGWWFLKRCQYTDCEDTYLQETWVTMARKVEEMIPARFERVVIGGAP